MKIEEELFEQLIKDSYFELSLDEKNKIKSELEKMLLKFQILNKFELDLQKDKILNTNLIKLKGDDNTQFDPNLLTNDILLKESEYFVVPKNLN